MRILRRFEILRSRKQTDAKKKPFLSGEAQYQDNDSPHGAVVASVFLAEADNDWDLRSPPCEGPNMSVA